MTRPVVDLALRRALRRDAEALAGEHPHLTSEDARERCAAWLAGEERDEHAVEPDAAPRDEHAVEPDEHATERPASAGRRHERPASRGD